VSVSESATELTCTTAAHASGWVDVTVTRSDGETRTMANAFEYRDNPGNAFTETFTETKVLAYDRAVGDQFGTSVSRSGNSALVGALRDDDNGADSGSAYLYQYDPSSGTWMETKLTASDGAADDLFGISVSLSGNRALVGAPRDD